MRSKRTRLLLPLLGILFNLTFSFAQVDTTWWDCDCPEPTIEDGVCVTYTYDDIYTGEEFTDTMWMPSECYALCFGFTEEDIVGSCTWEDVYEEQDSTWYDCDCPEPTEEDGVCVLYTYDDIYTGEEVTDTTWMPSTCYALCFGFSEENIVGSCTWDDVFDQDTMWTECDCPEPTEEDGVCIEFLIYGEDSTEVETYTFYFESACIAECYGFTEAEYSYDCDPETANSYFATSTRESRIKADKLNMQVYPNPFNDMFTIDLSEDLLDANITISGVDGRIVYQNKIDTGLSIDGSSFNPGIYFINVTNNELNKTIRLVKMK